jgi:uncharacterized membrane protein YqjE
MTSYIFSKIVFLTILNDVWKANKGIHSILLSELTDEKKQSGILTHSGQLFMASWKLLYTSFLIVFPSVLLYWIVRNKLEEAHFKLWVSLINVIGILGGLYLFPKRK